MRKSVKFGLLSVALMLCLALGVKGYVLQVASGTWAAQPGLTQARSGASAVLLQDGRILVTGGDGAAGTLASAELIGTDGTSSAAEPMSMARSRHVSALLANGTVLAAGGTTIGGGATNTANGAGNTRGLQKGKNPGYVEVTTVDRQPKQLDDQVASNGYYAGAPGGGGAGQGQGAATAGPSTCACTSCHGGFGPNASLSTTAWGSPWWRASS